MPAGQGFLAARPLTDQCGVASLPLPVDVASARTWSQNATNPDQVPDREKSLAVADARCQDSSGFTDALKQVFESRSTDWLDHNAASVEQAATAIRLAQARSVAA
jgi:hypothetical protein